MITLAFTRVFVGMIMGTLMLASAGDAAAGVQHPTPHELEAIAATPGPRLWYHEEEFGRDPALRATPEHVVILHLEPGPTGGKRLRNTIPYLFAETADYTFCVPADDPHIRSLELMREGSKAVVVHVPRGARCKTRTIAAGLYQLVVEHDGTEIAAAGKKAFVHVPRRKSSAPVEGALGDPQAGDTLSSFPSSCDLTRPVNPAFTFTAPNGLFVFAPEGIVTIQPEIDVFDTASAVCPDGSGNYWFIQQGPIHSRYFSSLNQQPIQPCISSEPLPTTGWSPMKFKLTDLGNGQFALAANFGGVLYPIVVSPVTGIGDTLQWTPPGTPAVFTTVLKFYPGSAAALTTRRSRAL